MRVGDSAFLTPFLSFCGLKISETKRKSVVEIKDNIVA